MSAERGAGGDEVASLEEILGYRFRRPELAAQALAHPSWSHEQDGTRGNERLEFLGDAVLDLVIAHLLFEVHVGWSEGALTRARAALVNQRALAARARALALPGLVKLGRTEQLSDGSKKDRILANCLEAVLGAVYLDGGLEPLTGIVQRIYGEAVRGEARRGRDAKTKFQEWAHASLSLTPRYRTVRDSGTENDALRFTVEVQVGGESWGEGAGRSKREAEQCAARAALERVAQREAPGA